MSATGASVVVAFVGGVASFSSPCVLPLVPAYLAVIGGPEASRRAQRAVPVGAAVEGSSAALVAPGAPSQLSRRRIGAITRDTALFIFGFGTVFVLLGLSASAIGRAVLQQQGLLTRVSGVVVVAMALFVAGTLLLRTPGLYQEWRLHPRLARLGCLAAPVAGAAFAFGWTPCVGPILASVLALSADQGHVAQGALLLGVYSLGLGTPFLAVALFFDHLQAPLAWMRRHGRGVTAFSAAGLGGLGLLLVLDRLAWVTTLLQHAL